MEIPAADASSVPQAYRENEFALFWHKRERPTPRAREVRALLQNASAYGLHPAAYDPAKAARRLLDSCPNADSTFVDDVALSSEILKFVRHLHVGRVDPRAAEFDLPFAREPLNAYQVLHHIAASDVLETAIAKYEPRASSYRLLKSTLSRYRRLASDASLTQLPPLSNKSIKPGEIYTGGAQLRSLLRAVGDLPTDHEALGDADELDEALVDGIKAFQQRHGLDADGVLGPKTYAALATPLTFRVRQIELTLERWRWLPDLQPPTVIINIPQFMLFALPRPDATSSMPLEMPIVVGEPRNRTPIFADEIEAVTFRPYWNVPYSIMRKELLPLIRRDPTYLERHGYEIVRGDSDAVPVVALTPEHLEQLQAGKLRLRQRPGPNNALGLLKFELPNVYNVYLHDTPAAALFKKPARAFSHGCIRVGEPILLAEYVLKNARGTWDTDTIQAAMHDKDNVKVRLMQPIPVMLLYGTALATQSRGMMFFEDVYGHDQRLEQLLSDAS